VILAYISLSQSLRGEECLKARKREKREENEEGRRRECAGLFWQGFYFEERQCPSFLGGAERRPSLAGGHRVQRFERPLLIELCRDVYTYYVGVEQ
jgi:hypothetical protein